MERLGSEEPEGSKVVVAEHSLPCHNSGCCIDVKRRNSNVEPRDTGL